MQFFDDGLANENSGIREQMHVTAKFRPVPAVFSTLQIKHFV